MTCCCLGMQDISQHLRLFAMQCTLLRDRWKGLLHTACSHQYSIQRLFPNTKCKLCIPPFYKIRSLSRHDCTDAFCSDIFHTCLHRFVYQIWMQTSGGKCQCTHIDSYACYIWLAIDLVYCSAVHEDKQELTSQLLLNHSWQKATQIIDKDMKDYVVFHGDGKESYSQSTRNVHYKSMQCCISVSVCAFGGH